MELFKRAFLKYAAISKVEYYYKKNFNIFLKFEVVLHSIW
jgi:hypothetical protein